MNRFGSYIRMFLVFFIIQTFLFRNLYLSTWVIIFIYPYPLIVLHPTLNKNAGLVIGFLTGLVMDFFYNTTAVHASACTTMMFFRPFLLNYFAPRKGFDDFSKINENFFGEREYWFYLSLMLLVHHLFLFILEAFRIDLIPASIFRGIVSTFTGVIFIYLFKKLFIRRLEEA